MSWSAVAAPLSIEGLANADGRARLGELLNGGALVMVRSGGQRTDGNDSSRGLKDTGARRVNGVRQAGGLARTHKEGMVHHA